jgi:hypothetical protein
MLLCHLATNRLFQFSYGGPMYVNRGNGWYGTPGGHDGGPWYTSPHVHVIPADTGRICDVCGVELGWDRPSGVCSETCLRVGQGFAPAS